MSNRYTYIGFLANVDSTIMNYKFGPGFKVEKLSTYEAVDLLQELEDIKKFEIAEGILYDRNNINEAEDAVYIVKKQFNSITPIDNMGNKKKMWRVSASFEYQFLNKYYNVINLLRLINGGNICITREYYLRHGQVKGFIESQCTNLHVFTSLCSLRKDAIGRTKRLISKCQIPFNEKSLQIAFENYEISFEQYHENMSFASLMFGIEALFNDSKGEITYKLSRNIAVLLGETISNAQLIEKNIKDLYDKRSKLVHNGESTVDRSHIILLQNYLRKSIIAFNYIGKKKSIILADLKILGYGNSPVKSLLKRM